MLGLIEANADATIDVLKNIWARENNQYISRSSWHRELHRLGYSKKKKVMRSSRLLCSEIARQRVAYLEIMPKLPGRKLKFLDESGFQMGLQRERAWTQRGHLPLYYGHVRPGKNFTIIAAVSALGLEAMEYQDHAMKKIDFERFIDKSLAPRIDRDDILIMDNLGSHRSHHVAETLQVLGADILFLPPYSPDLNPIEEFWHPLKSAVRKENNIAAGEKPNDDLFGSILQKCWDSMATFDLEPLIHHAGYSLS